MTSMFSNAKFFNQPLDSWNTGALTSTVQMFSNTLISVLEEAERRFVKFFNQPLDSWNTGALTSTVFMFSCSYNPMYQLVPCAFNQPLDSWNTSAVTDMTRMFYSASTFNQ